MGLFDRIFSKKVQPRGQDQGFFQLLNGYTPVFTNWGGRIYENELVRSAIDARARHISKLEVQILGNAKPSLQTKLRQAPNEWQTWSQFLYRASTILDVTNNCIIVPVVNQYGEITGVYPVLPQTATLVQYNGKPYVRFMFNNGQTGAMELENVGILTKHQYLNDIFGESNFALTPTMELVNIQNQGIKEGVKSSATYRFMATMNNFANDTDLAKERSRFTRENLESGSGLLLFPNTYKDIKQIDSKPFVVDADQMNAISKNIQNYFGVSEDILQNKAYGDSWSAFYEGAIEPFSIQFSEVMTKMLFTFRERSLGAKVIATSNRLQYMSNKDKLEVSAQMLDRGIFSINDVRAIWNLPTDDSGDIRIIRGEYYNVNEKVDNNDGTNE